MNTLSSWKAAPDTSTINWNLPVSTYPVTGHEEAGYLVVSLVDPVVVVRLECTTCHARDLDLVRHEVVRT